MLRDSPDRYNLYDKNISALKSAMLLNTGINDIFIFDSESKKLFGNNSLEASAISKEINLSIIGIQYIPSIKTFAIATPIFSPSKEFGQSVILGYIIALIDENYLTNRTHGPSDPQQNILFTLQEPDGTVIFQSGDFSFQSKGKSHLIEQTVRLDTPGLLLTVCYAPRIAMGASGLKILFYSLLAFFLILLALIWILEIKNIINPISSFTRQITYLKNNPGEMAQHNTSIDGYPEIITLQSEFIQMKGEVLRLSSEMYELKLLKTQAELQFLRSQINPHFLFNTFETIIGIAAEHNETEIFEISKSLSNIFDFSLRGDSFVPLHKELKMIADYLKIQKIRFPERLAVSFLIDQETLNRIIPKMILQPIVENAVIHGMEESSAICKITCQAQIIAGMLIISVKNTGPKISDGKLEELTQMFERPLSMKLETNTGSGIGLKNVNHRLKLNYGNEYCLQVSSNAEETSFTIRIPETEPKGKLK
jgi:Predicted signal transduction protein with a C-terminal ATPase domain